MKIENLKTLQREIWKEILSESPLIRTVMSGEADVRLYALYLIETFHYTSHNARNQALVAVRSQTEDVRYLKFCLKHAYEELGHELMALHDLKSLNPKMEFVKEDLPRPLPATEVLISYLYWISLQGNPLERLGYSFWAENCYEAIGPVLNKIRTQFNLKPQQMSFFVQHAEIDDKHAQEVEQIILQSAKTEKDFEDISRMLETSLRLTGRVLDDVYLAYQNLKEGKPSPYAFLNGLIEGKSS